jgi:hypothetical protein
MIDFVDFLMQIFAERSTNNNGGERERERHIYAVDVQLKEVLKLCDTCHAICKVIGI